MMEPCKFKELSESKLLEVLHSNDFQHLFAGNKSDEEVFSILFEHTTNGRVWITDDEEKQTCVYVFDTKGVNKDKLLTVSNPLTKDLYLWHIDGVMFTRLSKCDCALIHEDVLHLIEFKANAVTENPSSLREHYDKATSQLQLTLSYLSDLYHSFGYDLFNEFSDVDALIVFDRKIPQDSAYQKNISAKFLQETTILLKFGNEIKV